VQCFLDLLLISTLINERKGVENMVFWNVMFNVCYVGIQLLGTRYKRDMLRLRILYTRYFKIQIHIF